MPHPPPTTGDEIRAAYLRFFEERGHLIMPSASLIPAGDPTLLLTSAGMAPFKPYYAGDEIPPSRRMASCQKCFRTTDIDVVGDFTHNTMFEMLGNFSIGDYFKREAIAWAWEFCIDVLQLDPARIWVTVHYTDDEAREIWRDEVGVPDERIVTLGDEDNFWGPAGDEGACGPSSELHYDLGEERGPGTKPGDETDRYVEYWNLVFPQFHQARDGTRTNLPAPGIDTGMGLDRVAAIMQSVPSAYETDLLAPIRERVEELAGKTYGENPETDLAIRVVTEHARSASFLIADGVVPANEGRGYVLRRVIRRGIRFARKLGIEDAFLSSAGAPALDRFSPLYPELKEHERFILKTLDSEEERFEEAIALGMPVLDEKIALGKPIAGKDAFLLYDTYGFPLDLTQEIARENGLDVDVEGFEREMEAQRQRGRASAHFGGGREALRAYEALDVRETAFLGYDRVETDTVVAGILKDGERVEKASAGDVVEIVLRETPFYPEGGGQVGDTGLITAYGGSAKVSDTQKPMADLIVHTATIDSGEIAVGDAVHAAVDRERRLDVARNHTATHLLHAVLRDTLGSHVRQAGSLVAPERLRFDFTHVSGVERDELAAIESRINEAVRSDLPLVKDETTYREATATGALAFFGERYADRVRTVQIGETNPVSFEVCGGTHLERTGQIGVFHIVGESSVGAGVRRIEAVTGRGGDAWIGQRLSALEEAAAKLRAAPAELPQRVDALLAQVEEAKRSSQGGRREASQQEAEELLTRAEDIAGVKVLAARSGAPNADVLRETGDWLRDKLGSAVVVLGGVFNGRPALIAMVTQDLVDRGLNASNIVREAAKLMGGGGGGQPRLAQAGGRDASKLDDALARAVDAVKRQAV